jgi:hypothetical protein
VEKAYVEQVRDHFTPEEMQYISLIESAHKQVEDLKSIQGAKRFFWKSFE